MRKTVSAAIVTGGIAIFLLAMLLLSRDSIPDLNQVRIGELVEVTDRIDGPNDFTEQLLRVPCKNGDVQAVIFNEPKYWEKYDHSVQVCYHSEVICDSRVKVSGILQKMTGPCSKGARQDDTCDYYYIDAEKVVCD